MKIKLSHKQWEDMGRRAGWTKIAQNELNETVEKSVELSRALMKLIENTFGVEGFSRDSVLNTISKDVNIFAFQISEKINSIPEYIEEGKRMNGISLTQEPNV